jgi:hypothetical protein
MIEAEALRKIRAYLLESISQAADEIAAIDSEIEDLLQGKRPGAGAA